MQDVDRVVRVVAIRRRRVRISEFGLREGEEGLSLFVCDRDEDLARIVEAVREGGKLGSLAAMAFSAEELRAIDLELIAVPGDTPDPFVNQLHVEAVPSQKMSLEISMSGEELREYFNRLVAPELRRRARIVYGG